MSLVGTKARQTKQKGLGMVQVVQLCDPGWSHDLLDLPETLQVQLHAGLPWGLPGLGLPPTGIRSRPLLDRKSVV